MCLFLLVCRAIVELHGGQVWVSSDGEGKGSTFTLELPVYYDDNSHPDSEEEEHKSSVKSSLALEVDREDVCAELTPNDGSLIKPEAILSANEKISPSTVLSSLNVLVVDDAPLNRKMAIRLISNVFNNVSEAADGSIAVHRVRDIMQEGSACYDVILMDNVMPNMDGPTASKELRALGYKGLIIGVTGSALPVDVEHFLKCGANHVLVKPLDLDCLQRLLMETLPLSKASNERVLWSKKNLFLKDKVSSTVARAAAPCVSLSMEKDILNW